MNTIKSSFSLQLIITATLFAGLISCGGNKNKNSVALKGVDKSFLDTTFKPGNDFYMYANNGWLKKNAIPASESSWGSFNILHDEVLDKLKGILEASAANKNATKGSSEQLIGDYYGSGMDSVSIEKAGLTPLKEALDKINAVKDKKELGALTGELHTHFIFEIFHGSVGQDAKK